MTFIEKTRNAPKGDENKPDKKKNTIKAIVACILAFVFIILVFKPNPKDSYITAVDMSQVIFPQERDFEYHVQKDLQSFMIYAEIYKQGTLAEMVPLSAVDTSKERKGQFAINCSVENYDEDKAFEKYVLSAGQNGVFTSYTYEAENVNGSVAGCGLETEIDGKINKTVISKEQYQILAVYYLGGKGMQSIETYSPSVMMENTQEENLKCLSKVPVAIVFKMQSSDESIDKLQEKFNEKAENLQKILQESQTELTGASE